MPFFPRGPWSPPVEAVQEAVQEATHVHPGGRCDQDGVAAVAYLIMLPSGRELLFCAHHAQENKETLENLGAVLVEL